MADHIWSIKHTYLTARDTISGYTCKAVAGNEKFLYYEYILFFRKTA